jgi:hypothetical protein
MRLNRSALPNNDGKPQLEVSVSPIGGSIVGALPGWREGMIGAGSGQVTPIV